MLRDEADASYLPAHTPKQACQVFTLLLGEILKQRFLHSQMRFHCFVGQGSAFSGQGDAERPAIIWIGMALSGPPPGKVSVLSSNFRQLSQSPDSGDGGAAASNFGR